ncbi:MAG: hypothetical protein EXR36_15100 [Betaproteobacteria bacterium]|nr:hypothetical protein [Betaproteobacteria bacterium]
MNSVAQAPVVEGTSGYLDYLDAGVVSSLYRNGKVFTRRDKDGSDAGWEGVNRQKRQMNIHNARLLQREERHTLARNGYELLTRPNSIDGIDFFDHQQVVKEYYPQCAKIVRAFTGAQVFAFDHNVRSATGKQSKQRIAGGQQVQGPAQIVHGDYTLTSAPQRLRDLTKPPKTNDTLRGVVLQETQSLIRPEAAERVLAPGGRFAIINVWRNIAKEPVATNPLALCDAQTVHTEDLVVFEIHYQDRVGENYFAKYSPWHRWFYYPGITRDEALLIKQWDSAGPLARSQGAKSDGSDPKSPSTFSFHTAFEDPSTPPDAPDRWSIEVRCFALYDTSVRGEPAEP